MYDHVCNLYLEISQIITPPANRIAVQGEMATFTCSGFGSFINISWEYGALCAGAVGNCEDAISTDENLSGDDRNRNITATLTINTTVFQVGVFELQSLCVLHQMVPSQPERILMFSARLMISPPGSPPGKLFSAQ